MFTGLVQAVGEVLEVHRSGGEARLTISCRFGELEIGESICVSGACLTVTAAFEGRFTAFASAETLARTGLDSAAGRPVNLERALRSSDRLGGHLVTGHVDARVRLLGVEPLGGATRLTVELPPPPLARQIAEKGSVALDGVSLTVNDVASDRFRAMVIPLTLEETTFRQATPGRVVNLETDVLAKYVARQIEGRREETGGVDREMLAKMGFVR